MHFELVSMRGVVSLLVCALLFGIIGCGGSGDEAGPDPAGQSESDDQPSLAPPPPETVVVEEAPKLIAIHPSIKLEATGSDAERFPPVTTGGCTVWFKRTASSDRAVFSITSYEDPLGKETFPSMMFRAVMTADDVSTLVGRALSGECYLLRNEGDVTWHSASDLPARVTIDEIIPSEKIENTPGMPCARGTIDVTLTSPMGEPVVVSGTFNGFIRPYLR